jgi:hypothetical protein
MGSGTSDEMSLTPIEYSAGITLGRPHFSGGLAIGLAFAFDFPIFIAE